MFGENSLLISSINNTLNINLETTRQEIATYIMTKYPDTIKTRRYVSDMSPQHIDNGGNKNH